MVITKVPIHNLRQTSYISTHQRQVAVEKTQSVHRNRHLQHSSQVHPKITAAAIQEQVTQANTSQTKHHSMEAAAKTPVISTNTTISQAQVRAHQGNT